MHKLVSTSLGIGYIGRGGGTVAAVATCVILYMAWLFGGEGLILWLPIVTLLITALGVWSANEVEPHWGKDDKKVVIDEVAGMLISLVFLPLTLNYMIVGLILFRFFDIVKPLYIRKLESLPGGWGVMLDDIVAGIYANIILQVLLYFKVL